MKALMILVLSCVAAVASDTGVQVAANTSTNADTGAVYFEETFTRNGQTNLVRKTKMVGGLAAGRVQRFYYDGEFVAAHVFRSRPDCPDSDFVSFTTWPSSYSVSLDFSPAKDIERLIITGKKGIVLDGFTATNGVFYPVRNSDLQVQPVK